MPRAGALGVVTLRLAVAAVVLLLICRPRLRGPLPGRLGAQSSSCIAMAGMNGLFYQAVDRIPSAPPVTLEVLGPLALSVFASRRAVNWSGPRSPWPASSSSVAAASTASTRPVSPSRWESGA